MRSEGSGVEFAQEMHMRAGDCLIFNGGRKVPYYTTPHTTILLIRLSIQIRAERPSDT
jgi:hypothetical protein